MVVIALLLRLLARLVLLRVMAIGALALAWRVRMAAGARPAAIGVVAAAPAAHRAPCRVVLVMIRPVIIGAVPSEEFFLALQGWENVSLRILFRPYTLGELS